MLERQGYLSQKTAVHGYILTLQDFAAALHHLKALHVLDLYNSVLIKSNLE